MVNLLLGITIALLPLYLRIAGEDTSRSSKNSLFLSIAMLLMLFMRKRRSASWYMMIAAAYALIYIVLNQHDLLSSAVASQTIYISVGVLFFIKYYECFEYKSIQYLFDGMIVGALIQSVLAIGGYFGHEWYYELVALLNPNIDLDFTHQPSGSGNVVGSLDNLNLLASYLCLTIPAFLTRKKLCVLSVIPLAALLLSGGVMGISSLLAGGVYYLLKKKKLLYLSAIPAMIILPFFNIGMDSGRFEGWRTLLHNASWNHWLFGSGAGWFPDQKIRIFGGVAAKLAEEHNAYLTIFNIYGLLGLVLLLPIFIEFIISKDRNPLVSTIVFIAFCNSYGHFTLHQSTVMVVIIPMLCIALNIDRET